MTLSMKNPYPGKLFVVEGIDGSGKSTQLALLEKWLESQGYSVFFTAWNSSDLVKDTTRWGKKKNILTPTTFSLLHTADFADRLFHQIVPPLKAGMIVLADRYVHTAFARDVVRGVDSGWIRKVYQFAVQPDIAFYFKVPIDVSCERILDGRPKLKFYEAGMDLGFSSDTVESFKIFQSRIIEEYDKMAGEFGFQVMDATLAIDQQQAQVRQKVMEVLSDYKTRRKIHAKRSKTFWRSFSTPKS